MFVLTANTKIGRVQSRWENGREYLVAPITSIVPGVLPGSDGPGLYLPEDAQASTKAWDGMPLTAYHPINLDGSPASAHEPGVSDRQWIGEVRDSVFNGKLRHVGWFDAELTKRVEPRIYTALKQNQPIETSTGLYLSKEKAPPMANWRGRNYSWVAKGYRPDHIAVLPDQVGACSINDGCGVLVNTLVTNRATGKPSLGSLAANCGRGCRCSSCQSDRATGSVISLSKNRTTSNMSKPTLRALLTNANPEGHNQYTMGTASHKARLDRAISESMGGKATGIVRKFEGGKHVGYKEMSKEGDTHYNKEGRITHFEPNEYSHAKRFGGPNAGRSTKVANADQGRHPANGTFQGKPYTAAKRGFADLTQYQNNPSDEEVDEDDSPPTDSMHDQTVANAKRCSHCGGEVEGGECQECGYEMGDDEDDTTNNQRGAEMPTTNELPLEQLAAWKMKTKGEYDEEGSSGRATHEATQASKHANRTGSRGAHLHAAAAHHEAHDSHKSEGNSELATHHLNMARGHTQKANRLTKNQRGGVQVPLDRPKAIEFIVANCDCQKSGGEQATRATLNGYNNEQLIGLKRKLVDFIITNAKGDGTLPSTGSKLSGKPAKQSSGGVIGGSEDEMGNSDDEADELEDNEPEQARGVFTGNAYRPQPMTMNQFMQMAPLQVRNTFKRLQKMETQQKRQLAGQLQMIANSDPNPQRRQYITNAIEGNPSIERLQELLLLVQPIQNAFAFASSSDDILSEVEPTFVGNSGGPAEFVSNSDRDDVLEEVTVNWKEDPHRNGKK